MYVQFKCDHICTTLVHLKEMYLRDKMKLLLFPTTKKTIAMNMQQKLKKIQITLKKTAILTSFYNYAKCIDFIEFWLFFFCLLVSSIGYFILIKKN